MNIDAHQHFWNFQPQEYTWMTEGMKALKQDFLPHDLEPLLQNTNFNGSIAVQARQSLKETNWLLDLANKSNFIKGVVGWVDLRSSDIRNILSGLANQPKLVGVRHVLHDESDDYFMLQKDFQNGIGALHDFNLTYDLLLFPKHLPIARQLKERFPLQRFVVDHMSKPYIREKTISPWREHLRAIAEFPNVFCKLSGMVTEAEWNKWDKTDFKPYLDIALEAFGTDRVMIGSDWPVCILSGSYHSTMDIVVDYVSQFSEEIRSKILGANCSKFYNINL